MNLSKFIYSNSAYFFVLFFLLALWAFWPGYFGRLEADIPSRIHIHGISMTLWCLMLISLVMWDWRHRKQFTVFPVALGLLLAYHISVTFFYPLSWWQSIGDWIMGLPLS